MRTRAGVLAASLYVSVLGLLASAGATLAAPLNSFVPGTVQTVTVGGASSAILPLQVEKMYPGSATFARFLLQRGLGFTGGTFALRVDEVRDFERGCNRPEVSSGDVTCGSGSGEGELSDQLLLGQSWSGDVANCATAATPVVGLSMGSFPVSLAPAPLSDVDEVCLVVGLMLPFTANNLVQTDITHFDLHLGLQDPQLVPGGIPDADEPATTPNGSPQLDATPSPSSSPGAAGPSSSPLRGDTGQAVEGMSGTPTSSPTSTSSPSTEITLPAAGAIGPQSRSLPFTGGALLQLAGWAALSLLLGLTLMHAVRRPIA